MEPEENSEGVQKVQRSDTSRKRFDSATDSLGNKSNRNRKSVRKYKITSDKVLEERIPKLARAATKHAYRRALDSGNKVMIAEKGKLKEISPDGTVRVIKEIEPPVKLRKGQIFEIK